MTHAMKTPPLPAHPIARKVKIPRSPVVHVNITKEVIASAKRADSSHCGIAEAVRIACPWAIRVSVDLQTIRQSDPRKRLRYVYLTPRLGQIHIIQFDQGDDAQPVQFRLAGAHVLSMFERDREDLEGSIIDQKSGAPKAIKISKKKKLPPKGHSKLGLRQAALAKQGLRPAKESPKTQVPERIGGQAPPTTTVGRRRAFGLRAIQM